MARLAIVDKFGNNLENHVISEPLKTWLASNVPSFRDSTAPPYSAALNGCPWMFCDQDMELKEQDEITLTIEPKDPVTISIVSIAIAVVSAAYAYSVAQNIPNYENSAQSGKSIYSPGGNANSVSPSGFIRDIAGQMPKIYPDLICPAHRRYENNEEFIYLNLGLCQGYIDAQNENIYIAETPISSYAGDISANVAEPGEDISDDVASQNWYQSREVSQLILNTVGEIAAGDWYFDALGAQFTSYLKATGAPSPVAEPFPFIVGERFEITTGSNVGYYEVTAISGTSSEVADVIGLERAGGDTGRLEVLTEQVRVANTRFGAPGSIVVRNIFSSTGASTLSPVSQESTEIESIAGGVNWEGSFVAIPENESSESAEVDVRFSQGLVDLDSNNEESNRTVEIIIQWREYGTSDWNTVSGTSYTAATYDDLGYTVEVAFGAAIRPEFRFRRVTSDADSVSISDKVQIERLKCRLDVPSSYDDITTIQIKLRGTNALAATAENRINIVGATRKLPTIAQVRSAAAGTPFDLSRDVTTVDSSYDLNYAAFSSVADLGFGVPASTSISVSDDGLHMVVLDGDLQRLNFYDLSVPYEPASLEFTGYIDVNQNDIVQHARFADAGNKVSVSYVDSRASVVYPVQVFNLAIPYSASVSSISAEYLASVTARTTAFSSDGLLFYVSTSTAVLQYPLSSAFDLSTISASTASYSPSSTVNSFCFSDEGNRFFIYGNSIVTQSALSAAFDLGSIGGIEEVAVSTAYRSINVFSQHVIYTGVSTFNAAAALDKMPGVIDEAATRSIMRFVISTLYDALGSDVEQLVDWDSVGALETLLDSRGDTLDAEFVDETTLWDAIKIMLATGYTEPTLKEGKLLPARIAAGTDYNHIYTPDVMLGDGLQVDNSFFDSQEPDGVDVEYLSELTGEMEVVECRADGDLGLRPSNIQAIGITNETNAWRYGMRERNRLRYKPASYTFTTEMDALNSSYGEPIAIASDLFVSQCGEIVDYSAPTVTLDFEPAFGAGTHYAAFRNREGVMSGLYEVAAGANANEIELISPALLDFVPVLDGAMDSTFVSFGNSDEWGKRAIIRSISPASETEVEVVAEEYIAEVYADDDNEPG